MKILAMVHTYYMLMVVVHIRTSVYPDDEMDIIFTDACADSEVIYERLKISKQFNRTYYVKLSELTGGESSSAGKKVIDLLFNLLDGNKVIKHIGLDIDSLSYDKFLCYVAGRVEEQIIFNEILHRNPRATVELYEESYVSYYSQYGIMSIENKSRRLNRAKLMPCLMKIFGKKKSLISKNISRAWYFEPDLLQYKPNFEIARLPKLDSNCQDFINCMNEIFDYASTKNVFTVKNIFLEDSWHTKSEEYGDLELVEYINNLTKDCQGFVVKLHPRTKNNRFDTLGISSVKSPIPLELIILNGQNEDKVFLTVASGAPLVCLVDFEINNRVIMLYKCCKGLVDTVTDEKFDRYIDDLKRLYPTQLLIPENINELKTLLQ